MWCSTTEGIHYWDYTNKQFKKLNVVYDSLLRLNINRPFLAFDNYNRLWLTQNAGTNLFFYICEQTQDKMLTARYIGKLNLNGLPQVFNYSRHSNFRISLSNEVYFLSNVSSFKLDSQKKQFLPFKNSDSLSLSGLPVETFNFQTLYDTLKMPKYLNGIFVETAFADNQNTLWRGILTSGSNQTGLTRSIKTPKGFKHYFTKLNPSAGKNAFFPVIKDKIGTVWAGEANVNAFFLHDINGNESIIQPVDQATRARAQRPRALLEDSAGIWIGYFQKLMLKYNHQSRKFEKVIDTKTDITDLSVLQSFIHLKKHANDLLIVGFNQIYTYNTDTKTFTERKTFPENAEMKLYCVTPDIDESYWLGGSSSTLFHFDRNLNQTNKYKVLKNGYNIEDIVLGDNNDLWLSLLGGGLARFDKTTGKTVRAFTTADGLPNNTLYGMLKDKQGNLWISTNLGISRFNPKAEQFRNFGIQDGLRIEEFNSDNTYLAPDGEMFFAGMGGVVSFYPDSIHSEKNQYKPALIITDFKVSGIRRFFSRPVYECDTLRLQKGDNNFQVTFACLDFVESEKIKYRYRMKGRDNGFTETDFRHRTINFANLSPGKQIVEIEASNREGEWVSKTSLFIIIPPFFYQTWWFRVLAAILITALISYLIFSYNRQIRMKARQKQEELRLQSLRGQMNPHFIFNSLNSINYFISLNDRLSANRYIADFSRLIRSILGNLSHDYIPLNKELESLSDYLKLEHLRFGDKFNYEITVDDSISTEEISVFPGMVQPFVENSIWHGVRGLEGRKGLVKVSFVALNQESLTCIIEDDGIGRKLAQERKNNLPGKTSRGIGIVLERLQIINNLKKANYKVVMEDLFPEKEECGTKVRVDIPCKPGIK